uniref:Putative ral gtpase-activating protein subunit beta n=1 Tax=Anopheles marajoara TaxID=58244 RepID=A0A2M4C6Y6_9DIPT
MTFYLCRSISFIVLKPRLINILMNALQVETDPHNTHMLLGGLHLCVQDSVTFEACEATSVTMNAMHTTTEAPNLLSSGVCFVFCSPITCCPSRSPTDCSNLLFSFFFYLHFQPFVSNHPFHSSSCHSS